VKRDRIVVLAILGLGIGATGFAGWFRWSQGHRAQEFWGAEVSQRIRFAKEVELIWLESPLVDVSGAHLLQAGTPAADVMSIDGDQWSVLRRADIASARGLIHARQALIQDATFRWIAQSPASDSHWTHAMVLGDADSDADRVILLFDLANANEGFVRELKAKEKIQLTIPQGFQSFFSEQGNPDPKG